MRADEQRIIELRARASADQINAALDEMRGSEAFDLGYRCANVEASEVHRTAYDHGYDDALAGEPRMTRQPKVKRAADLPQWKCPECGYRFAGDESTCIKCLATAEPAE